MSESNYVSQSGLSGRLATLHEKSQDFCPHITENRKWKKIVSSSNIVSKRKKYGSSNRYDFTLDF